MSTQDPIAEAIRDTLISPSERGTSLEPANVVDVLAKLARSTQRVSKTLAPDGTTLADGIASIGPNVAAAITRPGYVTLTEEMQVAAETIREGLYAVASALSEVAQAIESGGAR